jgi:F-type H+-transporting ATPase subunit gamma
MDAVSALLARTDGGAVLQLAALHHDPDSGTVLLRSLAPFVPLSSALPVSSATFPPQLNIAPAVFYDKLMEHHLLAAITELFHRSLMAESRFRLNHIEGASRRMERRTTELTRKQALARQEEIIEEIEAILAGVGETDAV